MVRVVIALCYAGRDKFMVIPSCPFCFCQHRHRVEGIKPLDTPYGNAAVVEYREGMATKISECLDRGRTYALELRERKDIPFEEKVLCRGIKKDGNGCSRGAKKGYCTCMLHVKQQWTIIEERVASLLT